MKKGLLLIALITVSTLLLTSCSVYMASTQPDKKNTDLFVVGMPRNALLAEFGNPISSDVREGEKVDIFKFKQGYGTGAKVGRALFHGAADVLTCGLWEFIGTPTEATFNGDEVCYEVTYDDSDKVKKIIALKKS